MVEFSNVPNVQRMNVLAGDRTVEEIGIVNEADKGHHGVALIRFADGCWQSSKEDRICKRFMVRA
jgi:hypothetical protein